MTTLENVLSGAHMHLHATPCRRYLEPRRAPRGTCACAKAEALLDLVGLMAFRDIAATELPMGTQKLVEVIRALMAVRGCCCSTSRRPASMTSETAELAVLLRAICEARDDLVVVEHNMSLVMGIADTSSCLMPVA